MKDKREKERLLREYNIDIFDLKDKVYTYSFKPQDAFFECFDTSLVSKGNCVADISLTKSPTMITANFDIRGTIELICDRSLEPFDSSINSQARIFFKFGDKAEELTEEIVVIPRTSVSINMASYIYELIALEVPMRKIHPKFRTPEDEEEEWDEDFEEWEGDEEEWDEDSEEWNENSEVVLGENFAQLVYSSPIIDEEEKEEEKTIETTIDPRWAKLKDLKK